MVKTMEEIRHEECDFCGAITEETVSVEYTETGDPETGYVDGGVARVCRPCLRKEPDACRELSR